MKVDLFLMEENGPEKQKRKLFSGSIAARFEEISVLIFALTGILSRRVGVLVHKLKSISIQSVFALKYYTR